MADRGGIKKKKGFTLIEVLTLLFIFSIITVTFYSVLTAGSGYIIDAKSRLGAISLANEKMETIRNLKYDEVGTVGGEVSGSISQDEDVSENTRSYHVNTLVEYVQDPMDGVYPSDPAFEDYKKVTVTVSWNSAGLGENKVKLVSRFVPPGLEVAHPGDGILSINVFSDQPGGTGIPGSAVHVVNSETGLDETKYTDHEGNVTLMGDKIKDSIQKYEVSVSQSGYETINTLPPYPLTPYNPIYTHASVVTGSVNVANIAQNELADITVSSVDYLNQAIPDIPFNISGGKKIGTEAAVPNNPIYNTNTDGNTGSDGSKEFQGLSPGQYIFTLSSSVTGYELVSTDPVSPFSLYSEPPLVFKVKLASKNVTSLLVKVEKDEDSSPIPGAQVHLTNGLGYDITQNSEANGAAFFPINSDPFQPGIYDLTVTADGFQENHVQVTVSQDNLKTETIKLLSQ